MKARTLYLGILAGLLTTSCISRNGEQERVQKELVPQPIVEREMPDDTLMTAEEEIPDSVPHPVVLILQPVERDIPPGLPISADSLSMCTEYDYYPITAKRVKVIITNHTKLQYEGGEKYSLVYYNEEQKKWEPQPTNPIVNSILWIFSPDYPTHHQTIEFYTDENRAGKYRIYKSFNRDTRTAYAEFELISSEQYQMLLDKINSYYETHPKAAIIQNLDSWGFKNNDTLYMNWKINSTKLRNEFRQKVLNYSALMVNDGKDNVTTYFDKPICTDTFGIKMYTEKKVYPAGTESVSVRIVNRSGRNILMGTWYEVLRKEGDKWISLPGSTIWTLVELLVEPDSIYSFTASLYPSLNTIEPGIYRVVKSIDIENFYHDLYMAAEFRIGNESLNVRENKETEPTSKP